jgi:signal recognition particle subunit SRP54
MFDSLSTKLGDVFDKLKRRGALSEEDVSAAMREIRIALLEADVALPVARDFIAKVKEAAIGQEVVRSITPGQMVVKIVNDTLVDTLGPETPSLNITGNPPMPILMVGLQGSGKTTTTAKIAKRLKELEKKRVLMASLDTRRPAAQEQLRILGMQIDVPTLPIVPGELPVQIAQRAMMMARFEGYDVVMLDTAGRLAIDEALMVEVAAIEKATNPHETLLVADALTGQDAVATAQAFTDRINLTGIVLTRIDGDARGGAALSMRAVTGCPIKLLGTGEKIDDVEPFYPDRIASRILGMGDIVSLVEKAALNVEEEDAKKMAKKLEKGKFDMNDLAQQLQQLTKMGGLSSLVSMLPGAAKMQAQMASANIDDKIIHRQLAIISSMTKKERDKPEVIKASRKIRIAGGSGTSVQEVNKLMKQHSEAQRMMKKVKKMGKKGLMRQGLSGLMPGGGTPPRFGG